MAFSVRCAVPLREPRSRVFTYSLLQPAELGLCSPEKLGCTAAHALCNFMRISRAPLGLRFLPSPWTQRCCSSRVARSISGADARKPFSAARCLVRLALRAF